ncbi:MULTISPECIES: hypothetical protein [unclassified Pedobacter]|uniref:hypothetical protein n=1 Tax=unclassified Pedobacter TaxID=2628915 RepID=UPI001D68DF06|nr:MULTISPECIES: hypothetical protein [unclassified Pedobacter]CAH0148130.1 hypothetical protein SRABI36_00720 [Pedobacter sp. Bi36]CAH0204078.1 hypothetical protein SRABI126_01812 [Pedobacter sp. Bi126]
MNNLTSDVNWHHQLSLALDNNKIWCLFFIEHEFRLLQIDPQLIIHLVSLNNKFTPQHLIGLQEKYQQEGIKLIHLWEDLWQSKSDQVLARIKSLLGKNIRIHGRKTKVFKITKPVADSFLIENHLQGSVSSRYKIGLFEKEALVAVATFSALRKMNHTENYKSAELIRFAVKAGYSITGGLSKLIAFFAETYKPNDLMTYADRDWSAGEAYIKLGFKQTAILEPQTYVLDKNLNRQLKKNNQVLAQEVFNTGSLKFILKF